jgi:hypothetical protein
MNLETLALVGLVSFFMGMAYYANQRAARRMLQRWAASQGYRIRSARTCFFGSPFGSEQKRSHWVYKIVAELPNGTTRCGHVLCGDGWWGLFIEKVKVSWNGQGGYRYLR